MTARPGPACLGVLLAGLVLLTAGCVAGSHPSPPVHVSGKVAASPPPVPLSAVPEGDARVLGRDSRLKCTWVRSSGTVHVGDQDTREQFRANAVERARDHALRALFGPTVDSRFLDFQQEGFRGKSRGDRQMVESLVRTTRQGRILSEKILSQGYRPVPGCSDCLFRVDVKACIAQKPSGPDSFAVRVEILPRTDFAPGDEARIRVRMAGGEGKIWIYLYDIEPDGTVEKVAPNAYTGTEISIAPGRDFIYPDEVLRKAGVRLVAELPSGPHQRISVETIRVIATRKPLPPDWGIPGKSGYWGLIRQLTADSIPWMDDVAPFIVKRSTAGRPGTSEKESGTSP